ncbi:MAG: flagellar assembly protein FliX [Rhodospirillaceae bacterium]
MKISGLGSSGSSSTKRTEKPKSAVGVFATHLKGAVGASDSVDSADGVDDLDAAGIDGPPALSGLESLLTIQAVDPETGRGRNRQRMIRHAEDLLDRLEEVRRGLLLGTIPKARLTELAQMARSKREAGLDPNLSAILDEIELRAEVELAKLMRRP